MTCMRAVLALAVLLAVLATAPSALACGIERWPEKTLQDRRAELVNPTLKPISVQTLRRKRAARSRRVSPGAGGDDGVPRAARLIGVRGEDDGDVHLVISSLT